MSDQSAVKGPRGRVRQGKTCRAVIADTMKQHPGVVRVAVDRGERLLHVDYDPAKLSPQQAEEVAESMRPELDHMKTCPMWTADRDAHFCQACMRLEKGGGHRHGEGHGRPEAERDYRASTMGGVTAEIDAGVLRVFTQHGRHASLEEALQGTRSIDIGIAKPQVEEVEAPKRGLGRVVEWIKAQPWEAIFTGVTLVTMILGLLSERVFETPTLGTVMYVIAFITGGTFGTIGGIKSLTEGVIDIDMLMILAALGAAFIGAPFEGALLLFLFSFSNVLQDFALDRTRNAIRALMKLRPDTAQVQRGGNLTSVRVENVKIGEQFVLRPGDRVPLDGTVIDGESAIDQAAITGESKPVIKKPGSPVLAGTINKNGSLTVEVTKTATESTLTKIINLVEDAQAKKAKTERFLDKFEQRYAVVVIIATIFAVAIPTLIFGEAFDPAFYRAITLMVAASPCALIISTPASVLSAIGNGARRGLLFKGGVFVEKGSAIKVVAFDKTGTLTHGQPRVTDIEVFATLPGDQEAAWHGDQDALLSIAATVESRSEHVLAKATVEAAKGKQVKVSDSLAFQATAGQGVRGIVDGMDIQVGNIRFFEQFQAEYLDEAREALHRLQREGKTAVVIGQILPENERARILGVIAFKDTLRETSAAVVRDLKQMGVDRVVMLTGDNKEIADAIGAQIGVDEVFSELMPEQKLEIIEKLETDYGPVAMIGDGVNDAPALASAAIGVAMGAAGTDVALETADIVLLSDDLTNIPYIIALSRRTIRTLIVNLSIALGLILLMIVGIFTISLPLPLAVLGHEGGTVLVSLNGLRLLIYKRRKQKQEEAARAAAPVAEAA